MSTESVTTWTTTANNKIGCNFNAFINHGSRPALATISLSQTEDLITAPLSSSSQCYLFPTLKLSYSLLSSLSTLLCFQFPFRATESSSRLEIPLSAIVCSTTISCGCIIDTIFMWIFTRITSVCLLLVELELRRPGNAADMNVSYNLSAHW